MSPLPSPGPSFWAPYRDRSEDVNLDRGVGRGRAEGSPALNARWCQWKLGTRQTRVPSPQSFTPPEEGVTHGLFPCREGNCGHPGIMGLVRSCQPDATPARFSPSIASVPQHTCVNILRVCCQGEACQSPGKKPGVSQPQMELQMQRYWSGKGSTRGFDGAQGDRLVTLHFWKAP